MRESCSPVRSLAVLAIAAGLGPPLWAQCVPPPGSYTMTITPQLGSPNPCTGLNIPVDIIGSSGGGGAIQGFGFNVALSGPAAIIAITPGFTAAPGGAFTSSINPTGSEASALGVAPAGSPGLSTLATLTVGFISVRPISITFTGAQPLPGGIVPVNHLVAGGCDVVAPDLGLAAGALRCVYFIRGDCNQNGLVIGLTGDIAFMLHHLFLQAYTIGCEDACDVNDDGSFNISDPLSLVAYLFAAGAPPPDPFGPFPRGCAPDLTTTGDALGCASPVCPGP